MPTYSKKKMRLQGRLTWLNVLLRQGRLAEAALWAKKHKLAMPTLTQEPTAQAAFGAGNASTVADFSYANSPQSAGIVSAPTAASLTAASSGGAGVDDSRLPKNLDRSAPIVENPQLASSAVPVPSGDGASASPSGELEGIGMSRQADRSDKANLFSNRLESRSFSPKLDNGWVVSGEGVVWGSCANRWFVQVDVGGRQAKAAVGDVVLKRGDRVRVRLEWVSADGRDAEYAIMGFLADEVRAAPAPEPQKAVKAKETALAAVPEQVFRTAGPQSNGLFQTGVQTVHDQPKEVVFQTTTMEKLIEAEAVPTAHPSGKTQPIKVDDYRSPVLDDVPPIKDEPISREIIDDLQQVMGTAQDIEADVVASEEPSQAEAESENGYDYMERMRRQAYKELSGF